jgi:hypothetical protein
VTYTGCEDDNSKQIGAQTRRGIGTSHTMDANAANTTPATASRRQRQGRFRTGLRQRRTAATAGGPAAPATTMNANSFDRSERPEGRKKLAVHRIAVQ